MKRETIGYTMLVLSVAVLGVLIYSRSLHRHSPIIFSEKSMLTTIWQNYKQEYIEQGTGRTLDKQRNSVTTSEGVSYTMLRSVWMDDKETFDQSMKWADENLKRKDDHLYSWQFGRRSDGTYGVLIEDGGENTASDADVDIALSLIFAAYRWGDEWYLDKAKNIMTDIWRKEVVLINGVPYLAANDLEKITSTEIVINPSYFAPYAYRIFAYIDPIHPWNKLVDSSYSLLERVTLENLDTGVSAGLPPDWIRVNRKTGAIVTEKVGSYTTNYSYDALRIPWRIALDYMWFKDPRAGKYLSHLSFLENEWESKKKLASVYGHDGVVLSSNEAPAMYGASLGYFLVNDKESAKEIYEQKLAFLYNPDINHWKVPLSYYDDNWVWFGLAMYNGFLPNLVL